jgi:DNA invertase Pin-like site-specific DNA recombinase
MSWALAEFERDLIRERTAAGMRAAKRRGARIGRPEGSVDRLALVQGIRAGASVSALSQRLGVARATVRKVAKKVRRDADRVHPITQHGEISAP